MRHSLVLRFKAIISLFALPVMAAGFAQEAVAQRYSDVEQLRIAAIRLQQENDSLRMELERYRSSSGFSSWDSLSGIDPDVEPGGFGTFGSVVTSRNDQELMEQVCSACPSIGPVAYDKSVREQIENYTEKRVRTMSFALARYREYVPRFVPVFQRVGVPEDIAALVIVESAVSVRALSPVGAAGMWQLMPETAKRFGLRVDEEMDERYDPVAACEVAARYLKGMHNQFGNWILAIAAYNCGPGNVRKAIAKAGNGAGLWDIVKYLPAETRGYVPAYMAARYTLVYAKELEIPSRKVAKPLGYRVKIREGTEINSLCGSIGIGKDDFYSSNPHIKSSRIPSGGGYVYMSVTAYKRLSASSSKE